MFQSLSDRLSGVFDKLTRRGSLTESDVGEAMREVRRALLEADVALDVVKDFVDKVKTKAVNTRTPEGRRAYDSAVYAAVEAAERPIKAPEITAQVGGTALQVRKSLARLIETGKVTWEGKARGMRYSVV